MECNGFTCFLYKWVFCRQSEHPPVNFSGLYDNFIAILVFHLPLSELIVVVVNFGVYQSLWDRLSQEHCILEPTGAHNLAANGHVEQGIGVLCIQEQLPLHFRPRCRLLVFCTESYRLALQCLTILETQISTHKALQKKVPPLQSGARLSV